MSDNTNNTTCIRRYHEQTKHRFERYAKGPETLDWSMQPNPFRNYKDAEKIQLSFSEDNLAISFCDLYATGNVRAKEINLDSVGTLLELSMGLSAWKEYQGDRWALRCNPSSGNLHPTEAYIVALGVDQFTSGVYHYSPYDHTLEQRCIFDTKHDKSSSENQSCLLVGLSSIFWREAWKYGERAFRYCHLDTGHAIAAIRYACAILGWKAELVLNVSDYDIEQLLGLNRLQDFDEAEREHADLLLKISTQNSEYYADDVETLIKHSQTGQWFGSANILDQSPLYEWPIIDEVTQATRTTEYPSIREWHPIDLPPPLPCNTKLSAREIIQRRRSAQLFDGITAMESDAFFRILDMLVPRTATLPWDTIPWQPRIHLIIFVHRVNGLEPGLYIMLRNEQALKTFKSTFIDKMEWLNINEAPEHINLYRLVKANSQKAAATLSCHQRIASDSAFSLGMLSEFDAALETGPWAYKHLYWEAGMLGQVLYLEAEATDLQGTGIGCFFDDPVHEMLGIKDTQFQSVYHFTVGGALNDSRLRTIQPYQHLNRKT